MTRARNQQICLAATPYYHCVSRCVRRTFLCGYDAHTQKSYEHRREWIASRIQTLSQIFCIDICAYAIMSNHYHLVVHINKARAPAMSDQQIIERWSQLHTQPVLIQRFLSHSLGSDAEHQAALTLIAQWRERLFSLSWFMRELNFEIALKANKEDRCTGHFWESRYKSQALLDEKALLAAMAYTDLNPIRAGLSDTLQACDYTSIKVRLETLSQPQPSAPCLHPFIGHADQNHLDGLPFRLVDYLELVDWTGRQVRPNKKSVPQSIPPLLQTVKISPCSWLTACTQLEHKRALLVGGKECFPTVIPIMNRQRIHGYQLT